MIKLLMMVILIFSLKFLESFTVLLIHLIIIHSVRLRFTALWEIGFKQNDFKSKMKRLESKRAELEEFSKSPRPEDDFTEL